MLPHSVKLPSLVEILGAFDDPDWFALPQDEREARLQKAVGELLGLTNIISQIPAEVVLGVACKAVRPDWLALNPE